MLNPFKGLGDINQMRKQAMELQKQLASEKVEVDENNVRVVMSGEQKILELEINDASDDTVKEKINKAIKQSQELAAKKLSSMTGGLQGLLGS